MTHRSMMALSALLAIAGLFLAGFLLGGCKLQEFSGPWGNGKPGGQSIHAGCSAIFDSQRDTVGWVCPIH